MSDFTLAGQIVDLFNNAYLSGVWHYQICLRISLDLRKVHSWQYWQWMFECSFFSAYDIRATDHQQKYPG